MPYAIHSIYYTLQGEGANSGRACVIVRFAGCNLWSGREEDRGSAVCRFCDTQFTGGTRYEAPQDVAKEAERSWPGYSLGRPRPLVILTGGEPALQTDVPMISAFRSRGFEIAIETNGTKELPKGIHWTTVSPKAGTELVVTKGDELKLVWPQPGAEPSRYEGLEFDRFFLQPMDGPDREFNERAAAKYCLEHPQWRLSLQVHKKVGLA